MLRAEDNNIQKLILKVSGVWISEALTLVTLFLIQILSVKFLGSVDYGLFAALYSIITIFTALSHGIRVVFARTVANSVVEKSRVTFNIIRILLPSLGGSIVTIALVVLAPLVFNILDFERYDFVVLLSLNFPFIVLVSVLMGIMQGSQNFKLYSFIVVFQSISRLILVAISLFLNLGISGVLGAALLSNVLTVIIWYPLCFKVVHGKGEFGNFASNPMYSGAQLTILVVALMVSLHASVDVFWARYALGSENAGNYAAIAVLGKIVLYSPMGIIFVIFPKIVSVSSDVVKVRNLFIKAIVFSSSVSLAMIVTLLFGNEIFVSLFFGPSYFLGFWSVFLYCLAMMFLGINYQIFSLFSALCINNRLIYRSLVLFMFGFMFLGVFGYSELRISGLLLIINIVILIQLYPATIKVLFSSKNN